MGALLIYMIIHSSPLNHSHRVLAALLRHPLPGFAILGLAFKSKAKHTQTTPGHWQHFFRGFLNLLNVALKATPTTTASRTCELKQLVIEINQTLLDQLV